VTKGSKSILNNIQNFIGEEKNLINYNIVKKLVTTIVNNYAMDKNDFFIDLKKTDQDGRIQQIKEQCKYVVVFICGGGSSYEYSCFHKLE